MNTYAFDGITTGDAVVGNVTIAAWLTDGTDTDSATLGFQPVALDSTTPAVTAPAGQESDEGASATFNLGSFLDGDNASYRVNIDWATARRCAFHHAVGRDDPAGIAYLQ